MAHDLSATDVLRGTCRWLLRAGVDNVFDRRAWQETPYQYGHSYLYPQPPRTVRLGAQITWR
jgi:iron complex outermembrane receptor protein